MRSRISLLPWIWRNHADNDAENRSRRTWNLEGDRLFLYDRDGAYRLACVAAIVCM